MTVSQTLTPTELSFLGEAVEYLENPSFLMRAADMLGRPIETVSQVLPESVRDAASAVVNKALAGALRVAMLTMPRADLVTLEELSGGAGRFKHNVAAGFAGALGGSFGLPMLAIELPLTTTIMLRNIASVAVSLGEDLSDRENRLQCLAVFSLGGNNTRFRKQDVSGASPSKLNALDSTYYATRVALSTVTREAAAYAARVTAQQLAADLAAGASPVLVRYLAMISRRFNVVVNQKLMAQAVPVIGAAGGALVNVAFNSHFDRVARYHFGIRTLERRIGRDQVQAEYTKALQRVAQS